MNEINTPTIRGEHPNWYSYIPKTDTLTVIDDQTQWVNWKGKWGQQVVPGFSGGVGPKYGSIKYEIADKIYTIYLFSEDVPPTSSWCETTLLGLSLS